MSIPDLLFAQFVMICERRPTPFFRQPRYHQRITLQGSVMVNVEKYLSPRMFSINVKLFSFRFYNS